MLVPSSIKNERKRQKNSNRRAQNCASMSVRDQTAQELYEMMSSKGYAPNYSGRVVKVTVEVIEEFIIKA